MHIRHVHAILMQCMIELVLCKPQDSQAASGAPLDNAAHIKQPLRLTCSWMYQGADTYFLISKSLTESKFGGGQVAPQTTAAVAAASTNTKSCLIVNKQLASTVVC